MYLGRIRGIERPSLAGLLPLSGRLAVLLDVGANADSKPLYLLQFAQMAAAYMERIWKKTNPTVALLNIGEEKEKGSTLAQEAYALLEESGLNFVGNIEGRDVPFGKVDVIVTDGFTGNVVVKTMEGMADFVMGSIKSAIKSRPWYMAAGVALLPAFARIRKETDYREYGAGPLLGERTRIHRSRAVRRAGDYERFEGGQRGRTGRNAGGDPGGCPGACSETVGSRSWGSSQPPRRRANGSTISSRRTDSGARRDCMRLLRSGPS
jgi:fatty acid/phospholipid synthesis protein PlsX